MQGIEAVDKLYKNGDPDIYGRDSDAVTWIAGFSALVISLFFGAEIFFTVFFAIMLGVVTGLIANKKGQGFSKFFFFGTALAVVAIPYALLMEPNTAVVE